MKKWIAVPVCVLWAALTVFAWFGPRKDISVSERRPLAQMPQINASSVLNGKFMTAFEDFSLDQFPLRDTFREIKSLFHNYALAQKDNNGIYLAEGFAVKQEYPLDFGSLDHAAERFAHLYDKYLSGSKVVFALVPDKGQYLAEDSGHLTLDMEKMQNYLAQKLPFAQFVDLKDSLNAQSYYRTDTHWRQEMLLSSAGVISQALGVTAPRGEDFSQTKVEKPFYGVYYGQAALPMDPEQILLLENEMLQNCTVYDHESGKTLGIYDFDKLETSRDLYDVFLSGSRSLLTIENPNAGTDRELIVFRDSFGSSMVPLLLQDYAKVTVVDIRYIHIDVLDRFVEFHGQDVLMLYSTLVLNNSETIK